MSYRALITSVVIAQTAIVPAATPAALAAPDAGSAADAREAVRLYQKGRRLVTQGKLEQALPVLDQSLALLPSPNTELIKAHALRELSRLGDAMATYQRVKAGAEEKLAQGELRYQRTLQEARRWSVTLSAKVAELVVVITNAPPDLVLSIGGEAVAADRDEATGVAATRIWREPGTMAVVARSDDGREVARETTVEKGANATVTLDFPDLAPLEPRGAGPTAADTPLPAPSLPSAIALGVGVVGFGLFAGFGATSASTASELDECAPRCPDRMREDADSAETAQTVANVGLAVGITGLTAAAALWAVLALTADPGDEPESVTLHVGPSGLGLSGRF